MMFKLEIHLGERSTEMKELPLVTIGRHRTVDELHQDLLRVVRFDRDWGTQLIQRVVLSPVATQVRLVVAHIYHDLGLDDYCLYEDIVAVGAKQGLRLCTMEMAYEARLDYLDQPSDEFLIVMMTPELIKHEGPDGPEDSEVLLTLERLSNFGPTPWIRAHSKIVKAYEGSGKPHCWNPFGDPCFREVLFLVD